MSPEEPSAESEIAAMEKMLLAIKDFPLTARIRVLDFVNAWARDKNTLPREDIK